MEIGESQDKKAGSKIIDELKKNKKGNVPSLNAFFWLQHYYGCHPFESEIIYKSTNEIQL